MNPSRRLADRLGLSPRALLGAVGLVVASVVLISGLTGHLSGLFRGEDRHPVNATFRTAQQVREGTEVRLDGVPVGQVSHVLLRHDGRSSTLVMAVDDSAGPLYEDARAMLRWKTVLGGAFYVDLDRGTAGRGELGPEGIPLSRTARQVELDDVTSILEGGARRGLQTLPGQVADALAQPDTAKQTLEEAARVSPDLAGALGALRGTTQDRDLRALVSETSKTVDALARPTGDLRRTVAGLAATLETTSNRDADIRATFARAPAVMDASRATFAQLIDTLDRADPLLTQLRGPAEKVGPTLEALRPTVIGADRLLQHARPLLASLKPAAGSLADAARRALPLVNDLQPSVDRLQQTILPMLSEKDPGTTKSTAVMIGGTMAGVGSGAVGQMDVNGHFIRFPATAGSSPLYSLPCQTYLSNPDKAQLLECQSLGTALNSYLNYSPLTPTPGSEPRSTSRRSKP